MHSGFLELLVLSLAPVMRLWTRFASPAEANLSAILSCWSMTSRSIHSSWFRLNGQYITWVSGWFHQYITWWFHADRVEIDNGEPRAPPERSAGSLFLAAAGNRAHAHDMLIESHPAHLSWLYPSYSRSNLLRMAASTALPSYRGQDADELFICPYDPVHRISAKRFPYHLMKCRKVRKCDKWAPNCKEAMRSFLIFIFCSACRQMTFSFSLILRHDMSR